MSMPVVTLAPSEGKLGTRPLRCKNANHVAMRKGDRHTTGIGAGTDTFGSYTEIDRIKQPCSLRHTRTTRRSGPSRRHTAIKLRAELVEGGYRMPQCRGLSDSSSRVCLRDRPHRLHRDGRAPAFRRRSP